MPEPTQPGPHDHPTMPLDHVRTDREPDRTDPVGSTAASITSLSGQKFGEYEILDEIGRGGMGVVYQARHKKLNRVVALKMIIGGKLASQDDLQRFLIEAEASARIQHQNIVTVYEVGEIHGNHYFSMEFVEGESLAHKLNHGPLPNQKAAHYMRVSARALQFAHDLGFLHRDLKPSNIMIDDRDQPRIMDFGLAKRVGEATQHTQTGAVLGTPSYMSPEQAAGRVKDISHAADIYGLGAVLYELLTGKPPFQSATQLDTLLHVLQSEPVPPRALNPKIDVDLETICLKCLEKNPNNRYASADDLANDLQRYLNGEPIEARSFNMLNRLSRVLGRSHHDKAFHAWSTMLFWLAGIIFAEHVLVFVLASLQVADFWLMLARLSQFLLLGIIFWSNRQSHILPRTAAERELWTIWIGYIISYVAAFLVVKCLIAQEVITGGSRASPQWENIILYPISSLLSGLAFFIMGSNYWGRCYAIGLAFFALAIVSTFHVDWAPLEFGFLWAIALCSVGWRLHQLSAHDEEEINLHVQETQASD